MSFEEPERFEKPWVLLCEGVGDKRFYQHLFAERQVGEFFSLHCPSRNGGGRSEFGRFLDTHSADETFIANVKAVLIISDNDSDPAASFKEVQDELKKAGGFPIPISERTPAKENGKPTVVVMMIPFNAEGNLESLCLASAYHKWPLKEALDDFVKKTPADEWPIGKQAKMRMQTILAANNKKRPDTGFAGHWQSHESLRIPLDHNSFDDLVNFFSDFKSLIES